MLICSYHGLLGICYWAPLANRIFILSSKQSHTDGVHHELWKELAPAPCIGHTLSLQGEQKSEHFPPPTRLKRAYVQLGKCSEVQSCGGRAGWMCWCSALPWSQALLTDWVLRWPGSHGRTAGAGGSDGGGDAPGPGFPHGQVHGRGNPRAGASEERCGLAVYKQRNACTRQQLTGGRYLRFWGCGLRCCQATGTKAGGSTAAPSPPCSHTYKTFYGCATLCKMSCTLQLCRTCPAA